MGLSLVAVRSLTWFSLNYNGNNSDGQFSGRLYKLMKDCCDCFGRYLFACLTDETNPVGDFLLGGENLKRNYF